jgi:hypothetical protein
MLFYTNIYTRGNYVHFRGFKDGKRVNQKIPFQPTLYVRSGKPSEFKSLWGENLEKIKFSTIKEARNFVESVRATELTELSLCIHVELETRSA